METRPESEQPELKILPGGETGEIQLAVWEWPGEDPPLLFAHATAFHGRIWDAVIRLLPGRRVLAIDARGHGRSSKLAPPCRWAAFGEDLARVATHIDLRGAFAIGHSMGGHATVLAASLVPGCFRELLLLDPTIFAEARYGGKPVDGSFTLKRKNDFASAEEMFERFRDRTPFTLWNPRVLRDYCAFALTPRPGGRFALACPPGWEASIYALSLAPESNPYREVALIEAPVTVVRAGAERETGSLDLNASPTAPDLAARFRHGRDIVLPAHSHYIPMEDPALVAGLVAEPVSQSLQEGH